VARTATGSAVAANASSTGTTGPYSSGGGASSNSHPVYDLIRRKDAGDAPGEGAQALGASWYILTPIGGKVDNS